MAHVIKNTTLSPIFINDIGFNIPPGSNTIEPMNHLLWADSLDIVPFINSGSVVINDGVVDLSPADGIRFLLYPDRLTVQKNSSDITKVVKSINIVGNATVTDNSDGKVTIDVGYGASGQLLREVTMIVAPGVGFIDIKSNLLFEADPQNDTILFYGEEII
jgi:hypothetical protein